MANKRILYISYNGLLSHLGQSQILSYLKALSERDYEFFVISFDDEGPTDGAVDTSFLRWYRFRRKNKFRSFSAAKNILLGTFLAGYLIIVKRISIAHVRSYLPGIMGLLLKVLTPQVRFIFDMRGFMLDEYLEGGMLNRTSPLLRAGRFLERRVFKTADAIITLTHRSVSVLRQPERIGDRKVPIHVIPCCARLMNEPAEHQENAKRRHPGTRFIYSGSLGSWHDLPRMLKFFERFQEHDPQSTLTILSEQAAAVTSLVQKYPWKEKVSLAAAPFHAVSEYLAQADVGFIFYRCGFSRIAASPIKFPEYLWAGLAVVATPGVGDLDDLIPRHRVGVISNGDHDQEVITKLKELLVDEQLKNRCRRLAKDLYDLERGVSGYEAVYEELRNRRC